MVTHAMTQFQKKCHGKLPYRVGSVGRNIAYRDPSLLCRLDIHHIVAGGKDGNELQIRAGIHDPLRNGHFVDQNDIRIPDAFDDLLFIVFRPVIDDQFTELPKGFPVQIAGILAVSVRNNQFHDLSSFLRVSSTTVQNRSTSISVATIALAGSLRR